MNISELKVPAIVTLVFFVIGCQPCIPQVAVAVIEAANWKAQDSALNDSKHSFL
jgi:hypothetical protein